MSRVISKAYVRREITKYFNLMLKDESRKAHELLYNLQKACVPVSDTLESKKV
jgi:hypothetical protein